MALFASLSDLVARLTSRAAVQPSEAGLSPTDLEGCVVDAASKHNPDYEVTSSSSNVPAKETMCVVYLAWAEVCLVRASNAASAMNATGGGFSVDSAPSPFKNNIAMAEKLATVWYPRECSSRGVNASGVTSFRVSDVVINNPELGASLPLNVAPLPPTPLLEAVTAQPVSGSLTLKISYPRFADFAGFKVFYVSGANSLSQPWNRDSNTGVPGILNDATSFGPYYADGQLKFTDLPSTPGTVLRFIAVLFNRNGSTSVSNELVITVT